MTRLADSLPLTRSYWSQAEVAFSELLARLGTHEEADAWWRERLAKIVMSAWEETLKAVGTTPRALRALHPGERTVRYALRVHTREQEAA